MAYLFILPDQGMKIAVSCSGTIRLCVRKEKIMAKNKEIKTNAMRILDSMKISYETRTYECKDFVDGIQIADLLGLPHEIVYKTLVAQGASRQYYVFVIPVEAELDMKKAAKSVGEKSVAMLHVKDINAVTGYIRGGCTAIGMKKQYVTRVAMTAKEHERVIVSGGRLGVQLKLSPDDLIKACGGEYADILQDSDM